MYSKLYKVCKLDPQIKITPTGILEIVVVLVTCIFIGLKIIYFIENEIKRMEEKSNEELK